MNRIIKFRAWEGTHFKEMFYWDSIKYTQWLSDLEENNEWVFMQYTGLTDKNGKEVYEGDIVHYRLLLDRGEYGGLHESVVEFSPGRINPILDPASMEFEVIGNVYENQELLEE